MHGGEPLEALPQDLVLRLEARDDGLALVRHPLALPVLGGRVPLRLLHLVRLAQLKLIPRMYGTDLTRLFKQRYSGHATIVAKLSFTDMFKAIMNPSAQL
mgnify:CR=1 FL=1